MISYKYRYIYINHPKVASSSLDNYFRFFVKGHSTESSLGHRYLGNYLDRLPHCINMVPTYFTFIFVRNPFDKFVSAWLHRFDPNRKEFKRNPMRNHSLREYAELVKDLLIYRSSTSLSSDREMGPHRVPLCDLWYEGHHCRYQKDFLLDYNPEYYFGVKRCNSAPCSFIGRYETLEKDLRCVMNILGAPNHDLPKGNVSLSRRVGEGKKRHYSDYYDKPTRRLVEEIYADDLSLLGYDFEEGGKVSILNPLYDEEVARARHANSVKNSVLDTLRAYQRRLVFLVKSFWDRRFMSRRAIIFLFIYPISVFIGLQLHYIWVKWLRPKKEEDTGESK